VLGGRYRLIAPLGGGASAAVFAAEDLVLRRRVAVKVLHPALAADGTFLRRFQAEARLAAALRHPNVLLVHDWGDDDGTPFLVTELLEGGSLKDLLDQGFRATPSQALQLGLEACRGLSHAHRRGLVHRDVKPANLLFDEDTRLRVADFGLARAIAEAGVTEPLGAALGTARYASPEQAAGRPLDGRSDVYSLALVLVEAVTGEVPFAADTSAATLLARLEVPLEPPAAAGPLTDALRAAGRAQPEDRVDAAGFGRMLKAAAVRLDRPEPLPLVRFDPADHPGDRGDAPLADPTAHPRPYDAEHEYADREGTDHEGTDHEDADGGAVAVDATGPLAAPPRRQVVEAAPRPVELEAPPPRHRRTGRLLLLLVLLLVVAGLAAAAAVLQPWRPVVDVPVVVGLLRDDAASRLRAAGLTVRVGEQVPSESVEAGKVVASRPLRQREGRTVTITLSEGPEPRNLPAVAGRPAADVVTELKSQGLKVIESPVDSTTVPIGTTLSLDPPAGTRVPRGSTVVLSVSAGPPARPIPALAGKTFDEAVAALQAIELTATKADVFDDKLPAGRVTGSNPPAGTPARPGATVTLNVSKGPDLVSVPALNGKAPAAAQQALTAAGLTVSATYGPPAGKVFSSQPASGAKVTRGTAVALYTR